MGANGMSANQQGGVQGGCRVSYSCLTAARRCQERCRSARAAPAITWPPGGSGS